MKPVSTAVVCAATYQRPRGLTTLLESLASLEIPTGWALHVVIVDNDSEGSAKATIDELDHLDLAVTYAVEVEQGIPLARNLTTELAFDLGADVLLFIDDDEWAEPRWFVELLAARVRHRAPIVMGGVIAEFEFAPPSWATAGGAFQRRMHPDGHELDFAITANVLVDAGVLQGRRRPFDETLRYSGGEDLELFQRLHRDGHRIVFAPLALTHELIPETRVTKAWVIKRQFRRGANRSTVLRKHDFRITTVAKRLVAAGVATAQGTVTLIRGIVGGQTMRLEGRMRIAYGAGLLVGLTGRQYEEYRVTHGS